MLIPKNMGDLIPGDFILLDDITQLPKIEDMVAEYIDPEATKSMRDAWCGRVAIKDLVRPPKFNGTIADVKLVVMDEPYERLFDAVERGWRFMKGRGSGVPVKRFSDGVTPDGFFGFTFVANAKSTGKGTIGQIQAEIFYGGIATQTLTSRTLKSGEVSRASYTFKQTVMHAGSSVQRYVTKPKIEDKLFIELDENSKKIGFEILRQNVSHPLVQRFKD